jgi:hypothetical protein
MLGVRFLYSCTELRYVKSHNAECHYVECRYAESRGVISTISLNDVFIAESLKPSFVSKILFLQIKFQSSNVRTEAVYYGINLLILE